MKGTVAERIAKFNAGREPERLALKYRAMRENSFAFLRGTCHLFYEDLPQQTLFRQAPPAWICGDLHIENFGSYKGDNRLVYFDMNDFDEAILAPCTLEPIRLLVSIRLGARLLGASEAEVLALGHGCAESYRLALVGGKARWVDRDIAEGLIKTLFDDLRQRKRKDYIEGRSELKGGRRVLRIDGRRALAATEAQREKVLAFMERFAAAQENPGFFRVLDVARRIAGTGSLGVERYVLLVEGKGSPDSNYLLDLKQALSSALAPRVGVPQPRWRSEAERVVTIQDRMEAIAPAFLKNVEMGGVPYVLKGLQPSQDRVDLGAWRGRLRELEQVFNTMGEIAAWGQLRGCGRQGAASADELVAFAGERKWTQELLEIAADYAGKIEADWKAYCASDLGA